jgi:hypothetical protein
MNKIIITVSLAVLFLSYQAYKVIVNQGIQAIQAYEQRGLTN